MNRWYCGVLFAFLLPFSVWATQLCPWFGKDLLIETRPAYAFQYYPSVDLDGRTAAHSAYAHFASLNASLSVFTDYSIDFEIDTFSSTSTSYTFEDCKVTGRYLLMNDCVGDPVTLIVGATLSTVGSQAVRDMSCFHNGSMEYLARIAIGKEAIYGQFWTSRIWGSLNAGIANKGSPWLHAIAAFDANHWDWSRYGVFLDALIGFGSKNLSLRQPFEGYGAIQHRSVDIGAYFNKTFPGYGDLMLKYTLRPWAFNYPTHVHMFKIQLLIPFNP